MFPTLLTLIAIFHAANVTTRCLLLLPLSNGTAITTTNPSLLLYSQTGSAIMTSTHAQNLLLLSVKDNPAITMATHAKYSLQLIVESLFLLCNKDNSKPWLQVSCSFASKTLQQF
jgi:hypothetical protein